MAMIADHPATLEAHMTNFSIGLVIESAGLVFYLGHKVRFLHRATKTSQLIRSNSTTKGVEENKLED
ncbi:MAG: hypothetical protein H7240_00855 [Glaciimonas sp.]|nr:hypothetical protein [Glaciimonas sp.]